MMIQKEKDHILYKLNRTSATKVTEEILDDYYQRLEGRQ